MKRRERSPDRTVERKGRFTVITEEIPGNEQKRGRPDSRQHQAGPSGPRQPAPPPLQQQQPASQGGEQPQQPGGGVGQQGESGQDRPPPEPPPPRGPPEPAPKWEASPRRCSGEVLPRTVVGVLGGRREERGTGGAYGNQMRDQYRRLEGFAPDTILAIQEFKGIITTMERILRQELLTAAEDMKINHSFTFPQFVEAFTEFLRPNTIVRRNGIVIAKKTADFGSSKVMAIFAADTESLQRACCSHVVGPKHLLQVLAVYYHGQL